MAWVMTKQTIRSRAIFSLLDIEMQTAIIPILKGLTLIERK